MLDDGEIDKSENKGGGGKETHFSPKNKSVQELYIPSTL